MSRTEQYGSDFPECYPEDSGWEDILQSAADWDQLTYLDERASVMDSVAEALYNLNHPEQAAVAELCSSEYRRIFEDLPGMDEPIIENLDTTAFRLLEFCCSAIGQPQ